PWALGRNASEVWSEVWDILRPIFQGVLDTGKGVWFEDSLMILERYGYVEETYFSFNMSPARGPGGRVEGLFNTVMETTYRVLNERRAKLLREVAARTGSSKSLLDVSFLTTETLMAYPADIPFALLYVLETEEGDLKLAGQVGLSDKHPAYLASVSSLSNSLWEIPEVRKTGKAIRSEQFTTQFESIVGSCWPEPVRESLTLPITATGQRAGVAGVLVVGINPRRKLDEPYLDFLSSLASQVSVSIANARVYEEENRRAENLAELDRVKTAFFNNVSHEFRTPLTLMLGPIEDLLSGEKGLLPAGVKREIELLNRNAQRLLKLVNTLLDFSKVIDQRVEGTFEPTDLAGFSAELASSFQSTITRMGLDFVVDCPTLSEAVYVDRGMWEKIILNLLSNAFKFTLKGRIGISSRIMGDRFELQVDDTGGGIPKSALSKIFDRFYRVENATGRNFEGTGIGLALVKELMSLHGGSIQVKSLVNQGTTFTVAIPLGKAHLPQNRIVEPKEGGVRPFLASSAQPESTQFTEPVNLSLEDSILEENPDSTNHPNRERVLLADDNPDMREYLQGVLSRYWEVEVVVDGAAALERVKESPPDLLITDVMMPKLSGFELIHEIRELPKIRTLPVIVLSARAGEESRIEGINKGADDYLVKPFSTKEVVARVAALLKKQRGSLETLRKKNTELERLNEELQTFAFVASHDFKEPLRMISYYVQLLELKYKGKISSEADQYMGFAVRGAKHLYDLIEDLLTISNIGGNRKMEVVDLNEAMKDVILNLGESIRESAAIIRIDSLPEVFVVRTQITQLFQNIIANGIKYRRKDLPCQISVEVEKNGEEYLFSVRDNGIGIDPQYFKKIFVLFQRLHTKEHYSGTGIGLAICEKVVLNHGGKIWVASTLGEGSTFFFTLKGEKA
ncbi:MAG: ATP-binding protein, partial [Bdellovibrionia bacterium]